MEIFEKRLFEEVLNMAVSRFGERVTQRCQGADRAVQLLKSDPEAEGVWLSQFIENFFMDNMLNTSGGAAFILQALERRKVGGHYEGPLVEVMQRMAREVFSELVKLKTIESLEQAIAYGGS